MPAPNTWARSLSSHLGLIPALLGLMAIPLVGVTSGATTAVFDSLELEPSAHSEAETPASSPFAWPAVAAISLYQKTLSPQQGQVCAFQPTCSQYAQRALLKYGLIQGSLMASDRLQRCHYCAAGHYSPTKTGLSHDPVADHLLWGDDQLPSFPLLDMEPPSFPGAEGEQEQLLAFANHLCAQEDHHRAYTQFLSFWRNSPQHPRAGWALLQAGICLEKMGWWPKAMKIFGNLASQKADSSLVEEATFQMALTRYLAGDPMEGLEIFTALGGTSRGQRAALMTGWDHLVRGEWSRAKFSLEKVSRSARGELCQAAQLMAENATRGPRLPHRSPLLAVSLSTILPGSGKWYVGKHQDGLYSLLLVSTTAAVAYAYGQDDQWTKAGIFGTVGLFFYLGNIFGSAMEAKRFNRRAREPFLRDLWAASHPERWLWEVQDLSGPEVTTAVQERPLSLAEKLFQEGQYDAAITEYKRHLFLFPEDLSGATVTYKIGLAHLNGDNWDLGRAHLRRAEIQAGSEELRYQSRLRGAQSFLSQGLPRQGKRPLRNLLLDPTMAEARDRTAEAQYWLGICALRGGEWVEAVGVFHLLEEKLPGTAYAHRAQRLARAARDGYRLPRKSPTLAWGLSTVLPGSGQIYCGHLWDGLFSLALNASVGYLTVDAFRDGRRLDGTLLASLLWTRFYFGGQQNAARYAREHNRRVMEEHLEGYRDLMTPEYGE